MWTWKGLWILCGMVNLLMLCILYSGSCNRFFSTAIHKRGYQEIFLTLSYWWTILLWLLKRDFCEARKRTFFYCKEKTDSVVAQREAVFMGYKDLEDALYSYSSDCLFLHMEKQKSPIIRSTYLLQKFCNSFFGVLFCSGFFGQYRWSLMSLKSAEHTSVQDWCKLGVQQCFTPMASSFPMKLANTFRKKSVLTVNGESRQKTAADRCEILSHPSHYPASKRFLKYSVL